MTGKIVVLISGSGTNMEALADACEKRDVPGTIVAVIADRDCIGLKAAEKRGIEARLVDFANFVSREDWSRELRDVVVDYEPDLIVSAGFMRIISPVFVESFPNRIINLHPALLPSFPGPHGVRDALEHGVKVTGSTVHIVDNQVDHGPILLQEAVRVDQTDDEATLHDRIKHVEHRLLPQACRLMLEGLVSVDGNKVTIED
ncbi:MAG: phosphoribosylglycinamide formyltransferase 1 [Actinomycetota bacterium]|nr:phosphoribosylglycinamide formyltransferase 1 [Actinomycetota bacterium]